MYRPEIVPPRTVSAPTRTTQAPYRPWYEVAALLDVVLEDWGWKDASWHHWAVPVAGRGADLEGAMVFDPGRRAAWLGVPDAEHVTPPPLDEHLAEKLAISLLGRISRTLYRQPHLGLVSQLGESREAFQRRCLSAFGPALRGGGLRGGAGATALGSIRKAIEARQLKEGELVTRALRVGIGWYPSGTEPQTASPDLLVMGTVRGPKG